MLTNVSILTYADVSAQWNDIDHMDANKDFTLDPVHYAPEVQ